MHKSIVKMLIVLTAFSVAIPESQARRMGGSRSSGKQSQMIRQAPARTAPSPAPAAPPARQMEPGPARQSIPPSAPVQQPARSASPWGGMLGGALVGMGLGSLMSRTTQAQPPAQPDNTQTGAADATTSGATNSQTVQENAAPASGSGWVWWAILAAAVILMFRRARRARSIHR